MSKTHPNAREENVIDLYDEVSNPLDAIEEVMLNNDWTFERPFDDQMTVTITGRSTTFKMSFIWQDDFSALQFCCAPDVTIHPSKMDEAAKILNQINTTLWLGHFDIRTQSLSYTDNNAYVPCFRHTSLFRGMTDTSGLAQMEDMIDIALAECERYYVSFDMLSKQTIQKQSDMTLAMMDVAGYS